MKTARILMVGLIFLVICTFGVDAGTIQDHLKGENLGHPYFQKVGSQEHTTVLSLKKLDESSYNLYGKDGYILAQTFHKGGLRPDDVGSHISFKMWQRQSNGVNPSVDFNQEEPPLTRPELIDEIDPGYRLADGTIFKRVTLNDGTIGFAVE